MFEPRLRFFDRRNVPRRNPPEREKRAVELLEPGPRRPLSNSECAVR